MMIGNTTKGPGLEYRYASDSSDQAIDEIYYSEVKRRLYFPAIETRQQAEALVKIINQAIINEKMEIQGMIARKSPAARWLICVSRDPSAQGILQAFVFNSVPTPGMAAQELCSTGGRRRWGLEPADMNKIIEQANKI